VLIDPGTLLLQSALLAHVVTQTATILRWHIAPARRAFIAAVFPILLPVLTHLLTHLATLFGRQVTPRRLSPNTTGRAKQAEQ
jgi:hypothetical protein